ncbi:NAD(P)-dependent alcohol dehydrogenase [Mechercharimyces sp. CAU 1602]|uniref:NAD(P)-dependent alcohol dehydrogenase n=1 Tax=Mechercharimyces sp. CAU 1602 TaxID=2973933 RepID=UPI0021621EE1|nr:NAD(P)-dependent alcohol dehydrogenase [Mechercharimyces sp. CAU 1602]MCS1350436.1 NAD(P)-dependent alcohol dehydrogenase [Mechercharimyces sp. CAU 1602]
MKAVYCDRYGPPAVLELKEVQKPTPEGKEVLIRIYATAVSSGDTRIRSGLRARLPLWPFSKLAIGWRRPKNPILGMCFAGEVEAIGENVTRFRVGDQVYGSCGKTYAEYIQVSEERAIARKPANLSYAEVAGIPFGAISALHFLKNQGKISEGQQVLIYGASGSVGTYAIQLAKYFGAEVTAVCSGANAELVKSLEADHVWDYTCDDITLTDRTYDIIFDTVGKTTYSSYKALLKENGRYLLAVFDFPQVALMLWTSLMGKKKVMGGIADSKVEHLDFLRDLMESEKLKPVIDRHYQLEEIVEAHQYVDLGHKKGDVIIDVVQS